MVGIWVAPEIEPFQGIFKVADELIVGPRNGGRTGDQHVIMPRRRMGRQDIPGDGPQPPARPVPLDRAADPAAGRQAVTDRATRTRMAARLQHESRCHGFFPFRGNPKKFRPPLQGADGRWHGALRRQALAALFPSPGQYLTPGLCRHPGTEPVAPFAHEAAWLVGTFHVASPRPWKERPAV